MTYDLPFAHDWARGLRPLRRRARHPQRALPGRVRALDEKTGGPVPKFEKVEREEPADGVVIEGDDL